jgi:1-acyl-sn-glycerol-3-phosphate acyltransferase
MLHGLIARLFLVPAWWGRMVVEGLERMPPTGSLLVVPTTTASGIRRSWRRPSAAAGRCASWPGADLWKIRGLGPVLTAMGQIPIERGSGDWGALDRAVEALRARAPRYASFPRASSRGVSA